MINGPKLQKVELLKEAIDNAKKIALISHINPDGDAVGSVLALYDVLSDYGKDVTPIFPNSFPEFLNFLPDVDKVYFASEKFHACEKLLKEADLIISTDYNCVKRIADLSEAYKLSTARKILIDHHVDVNREDFDLIFSYPELSSSSEILYWILKSIYPEKPITKKVAICLYVGICTDTGSFSYSCNSVTTYKALLELMETGIDAENIHYQIYNTYSEQRLRLLGYCLNERMVMLNDLPIAFIYLTTEDLKRFNYKKGDSEGIVNYTLTIKDIQIGAILVEQKDKIRMSFRSKGDFDVNIFANKYFEGGGHKKASGANSFLSMEETIQKLEKSFSEELNAKTK